MNRDSSRISLVAQDEKRGLKGVFRKVRVGDQSPADTQDHWPVPLHERGERQYRALTVWRDVMVKQLPVGQGAERTSLEERANLLGDAGFRMALVTSAGPPVRDWQRMLYPIIETRRRIWGPDFLGFFGRAPVGSQGLFVFTVLAMVAGFQGLEARGSSPRPRLGPGEEMFGCGVGFQGLEAPGY